MCKPLLASLAPLLLVACSTTSGADPDNLAEDLSAQAAPTAVYTKSFQSEPLGSYKGGFTISECGSSYGRCLQASYEPSSNGSVRYSYNDKIPAAREYTLNYDVKFHKDFEFVRGGKLPGLYPASPSSGCEAVRPEGWSVRLMWRSGGTLEQYLYHQDREQGCGDQYPVTGFTFQRDRWYRLSIHVKVNSSATAKDGFVVLYVDGAEKVRTENLRLRGVDSGSHISQVGVGTFYGGSDETWAPSKVTYAYFDNFSVYPGFYIDRL